MTRSGEFEAWLRERIRAGRSEDKLPFDKQLCDRFGLSHMTVRRVLGKLADEGLLVRVRGKGTFIKGPETAEDMGERPGSTSAERSIVAEMVASIGRGELRRGDPVPSYKVLCGNFQVSPNTVSRALHTLAEQGFLTRVGKYYRVGRFIDIARLPARKQVVFLADERMDISAVFSTHEAALAFNKMERELAAHGHVLSFDRYGNLPQRVSEWLDKGHFPQGLVLAGCNYQACMSRKDYEPIRQPLERLLREAGELRPKVLSIATVYQVPHKHVVTFSISHAVMMMRRRLAQFLVEKRFGRADYFYEESAGNLNLLMDAFRMLPEIDHLLPEFGLRYVIRPMDGDVSVDHFVERYNEVWSREHMRPRLSKYRGMTMDDITQRLVVTNDFREVFAEAVPPVAWVFEQERNAERALDWCREHRMQVPRQVSVVGLENRREYADRGITACVRDWETMGYLMAHALIGDIPLQRTRRGFIAYGALLLERETTVG